MESTIEQQKSTFDQELVDACRELKNILSIDPSIVVDPVTEKIQLALNEIISDKECVEVIFTHNTDKMLFGVLVNPTISDSDLLKIIFSTEDVTLLRYAVEIDSKVFETANLEPNELAAYLVEEVSSVMSSNAITKVRELLDILLADKNDSIDIKQSINYNQILNFGIKSCLYKMNGLIYKPAEEIAENKYASGLEIEDFVYSAASKLRSSVYGDDAVPQAPKLSELEWCLMTYKDVATNYNMNSLTIDSAIKCTASVLVKNEMLKTLKAINRALSEVVAEASILEAKGMSIFAVMKKNGLRGIEDDLYEYKIRVKTCDNEEDAMYILRQINTRISLLEDYLSNTEGLSDTEIKRWTADIEAFQILRAELGKKSISKTKYYGVYVDYDSLDKMTD